jgi:ribosomal protein L11 methyltransferase
MKNSNDWVRKNNRDGALPGSTRLKNRIRDLLVHHRQRITPTDLALVLRQREPGATRAQVMSAVREMVAARQLIYSAHFSITHLEWNHNRTMRVSDRIAIRADGPEPAQKGGCAGVALLNGAAFGRGDHPTTRLALRGVDYAVGCLGAGPRGQGVMAVDVGTGSGVLAIAAVRLGVQRAVGIDIDPAACYEALRNVRANGLQDRITIVAGSLESVSRNGFGLLMANLRPPTLSALMPEMAAVSRAGACWVLSGFRPLEANRLKCRLPVDCRVVRETRAQNWACMVVRRDGAA